MLFRSVLYEGELMTTPDQPLQNSFRALADPTRRQILNHLAEGEMTIAQVSDQFEITRGAIQKHLNILAQGNLIEMETRGRERLNRLNPAGLKPVTDWLGFFDQFWDTRLGNLKLAIEKDTKKGKIND